MPKSATLIAAAVAAGLSFGSHAMSAEPPFYSSDGARKAGLPFSQAVRVGEVLYLSGQLGNKPGTMELVEGGMEAQARQTMDNIGKVLKQNGLGFDDVFKCTVMMADMKKWGEFNKVYL